jgi:methylisocitrate lyase
MTVTSSGQKLRQLLERPEILVVPGVYDCLGAKLAEQLGFEVVASSGFGISASTLGLPDYGFLTATEMLYIETSPGSASLKPGDSSEPYI